MENFHEPANQLEAVEMLDDEALINRRLEQHYRIQNIQERICEAQKEFIDCTDEMMRTSQELRRRGVDTWAIEQKLHPRLPDEEEVA